MRQGSLENPEVREDVPGHIIPILQREFDDFDNEAEKFLDGQTEETEFIGFRLKQGVYGQRQADVQMIRVKLPFGGVTPEQMETFADVVEKYVPLNKGHITTRQNIQIHHVPLRDAAALIREISDAGLSSREGCGNTVRNVTADPWAGVCHDELFDPTPYAGAYVRVSLVGIELVTIDARIVIASVDTYLRFASAVERLNIAEGGSAETLPELLESAPQRLAKSKARGAIEGIKEGLRPR